MSNTVYIIFKSLLCGTLMALFIKFILDLVTM